MVLVDVLVPIAWPLTALIIALILRAEIRTVVQKLGDLVDRVVKGQVGPVTIDLLPPPQDKRLPPA
jgi:hypothetical protein